MLLKHSFREPREPVSRINVALAIENDLKSTAVGALGGSRTPDPAALRKVSEAWQVLEHARLICPDLAHPEGDWWVLTGAGASASSSGDPEGEITLRLPRI
jgi:hypothetical protein